MNDEWAMANEQLLIEEEGDYGCLMDCQYEYVSVDPFDHYGFLSHHTSEFTDPLAEKGMKEFQIANCRLQIEELGFKIWKR